MILVKKLKEKSFIKNYIKAYFKSYKNVFLGIPVEYWIVFVQVKFSFKYVLIDKLFANKLYPKHVRRSH